MGIFISCLEECKLFQTWWKAFWQYVINGLTNVRLFGLSAPLQRIHPGEVVRVAVNRVRVKTHSITCNRGKGGNKLNS